MDKTQHYYNLFTAKMRAEKLNLDQIRDIVRCERDCDERWDMNLAIIRLARDLGSQSDFREQLAERA